MTLATLLALIAAVILGWWLHKPPKQTPIQRPRRPEVDDVADTDDERLADIIAGRHAAGQPDSSGAVAAPDSS